MSKRAYGSRASEGSGPSYTAQTQTRTFQVAEDIVPIAQLKASLSDVVRGLDSRRPIVITLNGKPAAVLMSPREFDRLTHRARVIESIQAGLADADAGRMIGDEELGRRVERRYTRKAGK